MPRKIQLTWHRTNRWKKYYRGKDRYINGFSKSQYPLAWNAWLEIKARIDAETHPVTHLEQEFTRTRGNWVARAYEAAHNYGIYNEPAQRDACLQAQTAVEDLDEAYASRHEEPNWFDRVEGLDYDPRPPKTEEPDDSIAANVAAYLRKQHLRTQPSNTHLKPLSLSRYHCLREHLEHFTAFAGHDRSLKSIAELTLSDYHTALCEAIGNGNFSPYTARDRMQALKQFIKWCYGLRLIDQEPRNINNADLLIRVPRPTVETFTDDEVRRLLHAADQRTRLYITLSLNTGMLSTDIASLNHQSIDWTNRSLTCKRSKTQQHDNAPEVQYPLWTETFDLLTAERSTDPNYLLLAKDGTPLTRDPLNGSKFRRNDQIHKAFAKLAKQLGISKAPKLLRKTAASKLAEHPVYRFFAQYFLGHAPTTIADRHYVRPNQEQFDEAVRWLGSQFLGSPNPQN